MAAYMKVMGIIIAQIVTIFFTIDNVEVELKLVEK